MKHFIFLISFFITLNLYADTPPPGTVKAKMFSGDGDTALTVTGTALNVNVTNSGGLSTVNQGNSGSESWLASITASVLPTNACQETGGHLASIDAKLTSPLSVTGTFWQAIQPVSLASLPSLAAGSATIGAVNINGTVPISGTVTATNVANGFTGSSVPDQATQVAGVDGSGDLRALKVSSLGVVSVDASGTTVPVSGTFWQTTQPVSGTVTANAGSGTFTVDASGHTVPVSGTFWQATQPVSGTVTANAGTNLNTSLLALESGGHLSNIDTKTPALGQALAAASVPVVLTAAQLTTLTPPTSVSVSGTVTANAGTGTFTVDASGHTVPVSGTFWQATQPVSATTLPLPTGAATSAKQPALGIAGTASTDVLTVQGIASMTALKVDGSAVTQPVSGTFWQATQPVSATSLPLPTGASTSAKQPALGTAGSASSDVLTVQGITSMTALKVDGSAVTQPVSGTFWQATQPVSIASLPALTVGSAIIGKVGIDQTTPGTTNLVYAQPKTPAALTIKQAAITIGTSAVRLTNDGNAPAATRFLLAAQLLSSSTANCYFGSSSVTTTSTTRGVQMFAGQTFTFNNDAGDYYAICDAVSQTFFVTEQE